MTFQSAHWNRNQSVEHPVNPQYVPTTLCASSFAIACYVSGFYLPLPAVASSPRGSAVLPTPASCFPFIVIAISILMLIVTLFIYFITAGMVVEREPCVRGKMSENAMRRSKATACML
jgi:hypothetical protein